MVIAYQPRWLHVTDIFSLSLDDRESLNSTYYVELLRLTKYTGYGSVYPVQRAGMCLGFC